MRSSINNENISAEEMMSSVIGFPTGDGADAPLELLVGFLEGDDTGHDSGSCSLPLVSRLRIEIESDTSNMGHGHDMSIDLEAEMSSEGGAWGMGRSVWSGVAEECSVGGDVDMGSIDLARHSASN